MQGKRLRSFRTRTVSTLAMIGSFAFIVYLGHVPLVLLVFTLQAGTGSCSIASLYPPCRSSSASGHLTALAMHPSC